MFRFNWKKIFRASKGNYSEAFLIFKMLVNQEFPKNKYDPIFKYSQLNFFGNSFLVNPQELLFYSFKYTHKEIIDYIALASFRSLAEYRIYNTLTLDLYASPIDLTLQQQNRLLIIENSKIYFLYEKS